MFDSIRCRAAQAKKHGDLFFATLLPKELITKAYGSAIEKVRASVYTPVSVQSTPSSVSWG